MHRFCAESSKIGLPRENAHRFTYEVNECTSKLYFNSTLCSNAFFIVWFKEIIIKESVSYHETFRGDKARGREGANSRG